MLGINLFLNDNIKFRIQAIKPVEDWGIMYAARPAFLNRMPSRMQRDAVEEIIRRVFGLNSIKEKEGES